MKNHIGILALSFLMYSCGPMTAYQYPSVIDDASAAKGLEVSDEYFSATLKASFIGPFKISGEPFADIESKLLDENPDFDVVINPKYKSKVVPTIPLIMKEKMVRITARLGKYKY